MTGKHFCIREKWVLELALIIGIVCTTLGARAQSSYPWKWQQNGPTIPPPFNCFRPHVVQLKSFPFFVGCYDIASGDPINCHQSWQEYFSIDGVPLEAQLYWEGGHVHARSGDISATTGGLYCDLSIATDGAGFEGDTGNQFWTAYKWLPQGSQVVRVTARTVDLTPGYFVNADDTWHLDPADKTGKSAILELAFDVRVKGLVQLPEDDSYVKLRGKMDTHPVGDYVTLLMAPRLQQLAQDYRNIYHELTGCWVKLSYHDMSLPWGGLFDYNATWDCPHTLHRLGTSADINKSCPQDGGGSKDVNQPLLAFLASNLGLHRIKEGPIHVEL